MKSKVTIVNVSQNHYVLGGSDRYFFSLTDLLRNHGHQVIPFTASSEQNTATPWADYFPVAADFDNPGPIDLLRYFYSLPAQGQMKRLIADHKPQLAHLHIYYGKLTTSILDPLRRANIPIVQTLHEYKLICPVFTLVSNNELCEACEGKHFVRALPRRCKDGALVRTTVSVLEAYISQWNGAQSKVDHFVAVSDFARQKMVEHGIAEDKITTVHNFVPIKDPESLRSVGDYILYFGRLAHLKGLFTLVEAIGPLDIPLVIAGDGPLKDTLQQLVNSHGWDHIRIVGFLRGHELDKAINGSLCTILPTEWYEPGALAPLESLNCGRAVIVSEIGGMPEVITDHQTGLLVPPGNVEVMRDAILWMKNNPQKAEEMGREGHKSLKGRFDPETHYAALNAIYKSLI